MTIVIIALLIIGYFLIATENINHINKAAVAIFLGTLLWCLYILTPFLYPASEHFHEIRTAILNEKIELSETKSFITNQIFVRYIFSACQVVLFFWATMSIVEVLNGNGCFAFIHKWLKTNSCRKLLWGIALASYLISANLDNLTTATLMLIIMHSLVPEGKLRLIFGSIIVLAVNCGGLFTVIGDINSLSLWTKGCITPTNYASVLFLPSLLMFIIPTWLVSRKLPSHLEPSIALRFQNNEDEYPLSITQRLVFLFIGIGGLWFIPTFHRITDLPPFVGAFCVLGLLWIANELCNLKMLKSGKMILRHSPVGLQYSNMQMLLFYIGITLVVGFTQEFGLLRGLSAWIQQHINNLYVTTILWGGISVVLDNIVIILNNMAMYSSNNAPTYGLDGFYWPLLNYVVTFGGSLLPIGTITGIALMKVEGVTPHWYFRHITGKIAIGGIIGFVLLIIISIN